ncbi:amidase [Ornithinimicrobium cavernae]|uniref:amidase n=1 Tax=Ornithinimicrobium cavernae TaxID=2666047 RepID=UPI000D699DC9|nr:amidase [Ornithinimicrobium cavernae]
MTVHTTDRDRLLDACTANIDQFNPTLNSVVLDLREDVAGRRAAERGDPGRWGGLLDGVPVSVKDVFAVESTPTTNGTSYYRDAVAASDAPLIRAIRRSGGLVHAKDNLSELSCGATNENEFFGDCLNPWDLSRIPGGSSGGSAVSVASGMSVIAYGTDAGGSVRIPAAINGVTGLRPTTGRLPNGRGDGVPPAMPDFSTVGPMARRIGDIARAVVAVDAHVPDDPSSVPHARDNLLDALGGNVSGLRIGIPSDWFFDDCDPGFAEAVHDALAVLESRGVVLQDIDLPGSRRTHETQTTMVLPQYVSATNGRFDAAPETFGAQVLSRLQIGAATSAVEYVDALRRRNEWKRTLASAFEGIDLIATPTVPVAPPVTGGADMISATRAVSRNTYAWSLADVPTLTLPCGIADGFPVGLQLTAAPWEERVLVAVGDAYQQLTDWHLAVPPLGADPTLT